MKKIIILLAIFTPLLALAQSGTNSPYSQYGIGILSDQSTGFNRGMNGVSIAMHQSNQVNQQNPASYAFVDSLTFLFDVGASAQITNINENGIKKNIKNASFDYVVMSYRLVKNLGMSVGIVPFSNIGYNYYTINKVSNGNTTTNTTENSGSGGTRNLYAGIGWQPFKGFAIGANIGYFWGTYNKSIVNTLSNTEADNISRYYTADISHYKLDLGLQYDLRVGKKDVVTIGGTYTYGHKVGDAEVSDINKRALDSKKDTTTFALKNSLFIPTAFGVGLAWRHGTKWHVGVDYTMQKWTENPFPSFISDGKNSNYILSDNELLDRQKFVLGGEYVPNALSRRYLNRVRIRAGVGYATPYVKINGVDGPKELTASLGFGLPITVGGGRSLLNISAQWMQNSAKNMIKENSFRINLGITFNERWFMKWKLE